MRYASVCDGIGAVHEAWKPLGWECAWTSEIEPFPAAVVEHHHQLPNLGDMTKITQEQLDERGAIELLVGGTPCQSFSVAGLRGGLADSRGNLALRFLQLAAATRPRWLLWENVPGVLSSGGGRDFGCILGGMAECGYGFAYRVLDAQYFGLAQRRQRVFVVGHLGDWRRAAAVLFERHSLSGHPAPRRQKGQGTSHPVAPCLDASGVGFARTGDIRGQDPVVAEISHCLNAGGMGRIDYETETFVTMAFKSGQSEAAGGVFVTEEYAPTLQSQSNGSTAVPAIAFDWQKGNDKNNPRPSTMNVSKEQSQTLGSTRVPAVAFQTRIARNGRGQPKDIVDALTSCEGGTHADSKPHVAGTFGVRRITPREAERLQGFPDDFTAITFRGKPAADGPRYKALGNSMAVPCMAWIGRRIQMVDELGRSA